MWSDPWLKEDGNFKLEMLASHDLTQLRVYDLWVPNHRGWDVELLENSSRSTKTKVFSDEYLATTTNIVTKYVFLSW